MTSSSLVLAPLALHPELLTELAAWHHRECLRQGLSSSLALRQQRLQAHLGPGALPCSLLALEADQPLGCVSLVRYAYRPAGAPANAPAPVWLSSLYVQPEARRRGIGAALIAAAVTRARALQLPELWLSSTDHTDYYRRLGWLPVRSTRVGRRLAQVMRRSLADTTDGSRLHAGQGG